MKDKRPELDLEAEAVIFWVNFFDGAKDIFLSDEAERAILGEDNRDKRATRGRKNVGRLRDHR